MKRFAIMTALFALSLFLWAKYASAHPVTFVGGTAFQTTIRPKTAEVEFNYTVKRFLAFGLVYDRLLLKDREIQTAIPKLNLLVYRWNTQKSQANIYLSAGAGYAYDSINAKKNRFVYGGSAQVDYETRVFYTLLKAKIRKTPEVFPYHLQYRIGFAPYKTDYDKLQIWLIGQLDYSPKVYSNIQLTPMMRFFYKNVLWEIGSTVKGEWLITLMVHI